MINPKQIRQNSDQKDQLWLEDQAKLFRIPAGRLVFLGVWEKLSMAGFYGALAFILNALLIASTGQEAVQWAFFILVGFLVSRLIAELSKNILTARLITKIKMQLRKKCLDELGKPGDLTKKQAYSDALVTLFQNPLDDIAAYIATYLPQRKIAVFVPVLLILLISQINILVALILLITGPLLIVFMILIGHKTKELSDRQLSQTLFWERYIDDRLNGFKTLKLFGQSGYEIKNLQHVLSHLRRSTMKVLTLAFLSTTVLEFFGALSIALVAVYVGLHLLNLLDFTLGGEITLFTGLWMLTLAPEFFSPLQRLSQLYHQRAHALAAAKQIERYFKDLEQAPQTAETAPEKGESLPSPTSRPLLSLRNIWYRYPGSEEDVLKDISLDLPEKGLCVLSGKSGSGKSTLFAILLGFHVPTKGFIASRAQIISSQEQRNRISWLGHSPTFFNGTLLENLRSASPKASLEDIYHALEMACAKDILQRLPHGLHQDLNMDTLTLSGGERQRLALARAILRPSPLLLLDEPSAHFDEELTARFLTSLETLAKERCCLVISHDAGLIAAADHHFHLREGQIGEMERLEL